jgi:hypothetical protein
MLPKKNQQCLWVCPTPSSSSSSRSNSCLARFPPKHNGRRIHLPPPFPPTSRKHSALLGGVVGGTMDAAARHHAPPPYASSDRPQIRFDSQARALIDSTRFDRSDRPTHPLRCCGGSFMQRTRGKQQARTTPIVPHTSTNTTAPLNNNTNTDAGRRTSRRQQQRDAVVCVSTTGRGLGPYGSRSDGSTQSRSSSSSNNDAPRPQRVPPHAKVGNTGPVAPLPEG